MRLAERNESALPATPTWTTRETIHDPSADDGSAGLPLATNLVQQEVHSGGLQQFPARLRQNGDPLLSRTLGNPSETRRSSLRPPSGRTDSEPGRGCRGTPACPPECPIRLDHRCQFHDDTLRPLLDRFKTRTERVAPTGSRQHQRAAVIGGWWKRAQLHTPGG